MRQVLTAWGDPEVIGPLGGGNRNTVLEIRLRGQRLVARTMTDTGAGLVDWDEARVDHTDLDVADLPTSDLPPARLRAARAATTAWEAANGWTVEPSYARRQLANLLSSQHDFP